MIKRHWKIQVVISLSVILAVAGVSFLISDTVGYRSVALILLLTVSILAMRMHLSAVILSALAGALIWNYFFIPPRFTFHIGSGEDVLLLVMYFVVASLGGVIHYRLRQIDIMERQKTEQANAIGLYNVLFSSLSHELRTPIAAILGAADAMMDEQDSLKTAQKKELLGSIMQNSIRLSEQVENLLNVSRIEAGILKPKREWCDFGDLLHGTTAKMSAILSKHSVKITLTEDFPLVRTDYGLMEQILQNLLINVAKHTPAGTQVEISAGFTHIKTGHFEAAERGTDVTPVADAREDILVVQVSDNGPGFRDADRKSVFEKFRQNQSGGGTGLGLFVVKGFTQALGGEVTLTDSPEGGAKFILEFPTTVLHQTFHHG